MPDGTLTMLVEPEPTVLVALTNCADPSMLVSAKVTEGLLSYDFDLTPQPELATGWQVSADGLEIAFELRRGVRWHDGEPFTSRDVAHSIELLKTVHPRGRATFAAVETVLTPDPHRAILKLSRPAPFLLRALAACEAPIVPSHLYRSPERGRHNDVAPIGTGPFVFEEWVRGQHIRYRRNEDYWDNPKPGIDRLIVRFIEDEAEKAAALEAGRLDLAPATPVPFDTLARLKTLPMLAFETGGYQYTNQIVRLEFNLDDPLMRQKPLRRAIAHAIDRRLLIEDAWAGYATPAFGPISPDLKAFCATDLAPPAFDPAEARKLLAGFPGLALTLDFVPAGDGYRRTADAVARCLDTVGIDVTVRAQDFAAYTHRIYSDRAFQLTIGRMNNMFDPSVGVQRAYWSQNFKPGVPFSNGAHYSNAEVDSLLERAAVENDPTERVALFDRFQRQIVDDLPDIALLAPLQITVAHRRVRGHTTGACGPAASLAAVSL